MAITGAHMLFFTPEAEAVRNILKDAFQWPSVDVGGGWLIFKMPPSELGVHPQEGKAFHQVSLVCQDLAGTVEELKAKGVVFKGEPVDAGWGITINMELPGGLEVMLYEAKHQTAY